MFKSLFESGDHCGAPNPLLTLAKNFGGHTNGAARQQSVGDLLGTSNSAVATGDLFVQEYLANVAQRTIPPSTFDMRQLMAQMPAILMGGNQQQIVGNSSMLGMEKSWAEVGERSSLASDWSGQFLENNQQHQPNGLAQKWVNEYSGRENEGIEGAWQIARSESTWAKDFLENYEAKMAQQNDVDGGMAQQWENEFVKMINNGNGQQNMPNFFDYETAWENAAREAQEKYHFLEANPYLGEQNGVEMAKQSLGKGHLADSILHFEAALQQEPNNPQIWYSLGLALAENEQDPRAIAALRNCLKLESQNQKATLALAVSLANESFEHLALQELHKWICIQQGQQMPIEQSNYSQYAEMDRTQFGKVESQFLDAASRAAQIDSELQNALSVLYNLGNDFDRAVDCLKAALSLQPNDPTLWNRLGATLANADRSAEAISAYKRALQISPSYVRARYNLGTACMNLNSFRNAAAHFIAALQIQHSPDQSQIWSRLRSALIRIEHAEFGHELFNALEGHNLPRIVQILETQGILLSAAQEE